MKLSKRLQQIANSVNPSDYDHIWDGCCDHGLLGMHLLTTQPASEVHFVDLVPKLIEQVNKKLSQFYNEAGYKGRWQTHCQSVSDINLLPKQRNLVVIAGVGGDLVAELVTDLLKRQTDTAFDILLCPIHHNFTLRQQLIELNLSLLDECIVEENNRFYEVMYLRYQSQPANMLNNKAKIELTLTGSKMWQLQLSSHQRYLQQLLAHYKRMKNKQNSEADQRIKAYNALLNVNNK